ncbi:UNVERIFIED_CONTAM: hypothetical protein GTU68_033935 [Idotea baltica]|nr:hypothetical protein [Idotea baltica]
MGKSLVIVESPAKAKTINKYLGNEYIVKSSIGHIRDLPTSRSASKTKASDKTTKDKAKRQLVTRMGVDPENSWSAHYEILPGKEKVVDELKRLAKTADTVYLATDLDREGEAIAWHLKESIGGEVSYKRVVFNEITKKAIQKAFSEPSELDINRVNAQQARRFLDRVVGYMVSPLLWSKVARGLSAGRVQSVAVKLVVEREKEIRAFIPEEYWDVYADLAVDKSTNIRFEVVREKNKAFKPVNEDQVNKALGILKKADFKLTGREDKPTKSRPSAPFITSTLQQAASHRLGFGVKKTMMMAQRLYEAGHITYMRTDSTNLSSDAVYAARAFIEKEYGSQYLPEKPNGYSSKKGAQEAHEAIRPSNVKMQPIQLVGVERDAARLYTLIWQQFVACQMLPAEYLSTTITVNADTFELRAKGRILQFDGYTRVAPQTKGKADESDALPDIKANTTLTLLTLDPNQHFTKPSARYSEATLVKEMEKRGIGRPSTYASIISTIQDRGYVALQSRRFYSEKMGDIVTERLSESFSDLMDYSFTANLEENLDGIAQGEQNWTQVLDDFYIGFKNQLDNASDTEKGMRSNQPTLTNISCNECGRDMMIRTASTGVFLGCSGYSLPPKERCKGTLNLISGDEVAADDEGESESLLLLQKHRCALCDTAMDSYLLDKTRKLHVCGNNPDCAGYEVEIGQYRIKGYEGPKLDCDKCGSEMQLKTGRFGKFFGCTGLDCKNTRKLLKSGEAAPPKIDPVAMPELQCQKVDDTYVLRDGASGLFLAASQFPKKRETRAPLVSELIPHRSEIDSKYHFLLDAPIQDTEGRSSIIRYSRKTKEQYVQTEKNGKPTGWKAFYKGGLWVIEDKRK